MVAAEKVDLLLRRDLVFNIQEVSEERRAWPQQTEKDSRLSGVNIPSMPVASAVPLTALEDTEWGTY